jgi:hypothetical protein
MGEYEEEERDVARERNKVNYIYFISGLRLLKKL